MSNMKNKVGQYRFGRHRLMWGIWYQKTEFAASFVKDVDTYEEAVRETYRLNGWGEPKQIRRTF